MANRRKDMWRFLYDLVDRNEPNKDNLFDFVDDILFIRPSVIRCYSSHELVNKSQDRFVFWLINKFVKYLGDDCDQTLRERNYQIQQTVINACLTNSPKLFESLLNAYVNTLRQLVLKLYDLIQCNNNGVQESVEQELQIIMYEDENDEFSAEFPIHVIKVPLSIADKRVIDFLIVLQRVLPFGIAFNSQLFIKSIYVAFQAFKVCSVTTKLACLRYIHEVFNALTKSSWLLFEAKLFNCGTLAIQAITFMWNDIPIWLNKGCMQEHDIKELLSITNVWIKNLKTIIINADLDNLQCLNLACCLIQNVEMFQKMEYDECQKLINSICDLMQFLLFVHKSESIDTQNIHMLLSLSHSAIYRILALIYVKEVNQNQQIAEFILNNIIQCIVEIFVNATYTSEQYKKLIELLDTLKYIEHRSVQQQQILYLRQFSESNLITFYQQNFSHNLLTTKKPINWDEHILEYLNVSNHEEEHYKVISLLLQITTIRNALDSKTQECLFKKLIHPLKMSSSYKSSSFNNISLEFLLTQLFCCITANLSQNIVLLLQDLLTFVIKQMLFSKDKYLHKLLGNYIVYIYVSGYLKWQEIIKIPLDSIKDSCLLAAFFRLLFCGNDIVCTKAFKYSSYANQHSDLTILECSKCTLSFNSTNHINMYLLEHDAIWQPWHKSVKNQKLPQFSILFYHKVLTNLLFFPQFTFIIHHIDLLKVEPTMCIEVIKNENLDKINFKIFSKLLPKIALNNANFRIQLSNVVLEQIIAVLRKPIQTQDLAEQQRLLKLIECCAFDGIEERWLFQYFKMTFFFLIHPRTLVGNEAIICARRLCAKHGVQPISLWHWYKRDAMSLVIRLALHIFLLKGVRLTRSLRFFTKMLGFSYVQEFICKYHRLIIAMVLPYCIKQPLCKGLIVHISKLIRKQISVLFTTTFLRIYTHICLTEKEEIGRKCINMILDCTKSNIKELMFADVKQTVAELLIFFNRNPNFVMRSFKLLLLNQINEEDNTQNSNYQFSKFIADRFLGVITHFESCLSEPNFEKPLKKQALLSLGQILRLVGSNHVTQFRFKIIAMLSFVPTLNNPNLSKICLQTWNIFLHTCNVQELGPSISCIAAQLVPLAQHNPHIVNKLYEFIVIKNSSMLSTFISELYFLEHARNVATNVQECVARQTEMLKNKNASMKDKLEFLYKQISNENLQVRVHGLFYLKHFFANNRREINRIIMNQIFVDTIIERIFNSLIDGCQHENNNLQLASAKCLGELGAIDSSFMPSHYILEQAANYPLGILTDDFAEMALMELCRAYQFQKDTKYVDNFSLAIQETLAVCGISPKENKKIYIWNALPERTRQILEPLLDSCYTGSQRSINCKEHPLFGNSICNTYDDWTYMWASRLIDNVKTNVAKHLLISYKPSIKRDSNTMTVFFPYILLQALCESNDCQKTQILEEIQTVFSYSCRNYQENCGTNAIQTVNHNAVSFKQFPVNQYIDNNIGQVKKSENRVNNLAQLDKIGKQLPTATKFCSEQIDFLRRWIRECQRSKTDLHERQSSDFVKNYKCVNEFVNQFDKLTISLANYNCGEYARALMYLEEYIEIEPKTRLIEQFDFLIKIYGELMDSDSVEGAVHMRTYDMNITQEILVNQLIDRQQEMITCYEQLLSSSEQFKPEHFRGMIDCYLRMDAPKTALLITDGLWQHLGVTNLNECFYECKSELLWRLGNYEDLNKLLGENAVQRNKSSWHVQCANAYINLKKPNINIEIFTTQLDQIRLNFLERMRSCSSVKQRFHGHASNELVKLHLLNEMEKFKELLGMICETINSTELTSLCLDNCYEQVCTFFEDLDMRIEVLQPSVCVLEPIFSFRRNLLTESKSLLSVIQQQNTKSTALIEQLNDVINTQMGRLWLASAQLNRSSGNLQRAQLSIMKAAQYEPKNLFIEKAKLLWKKGDQMIALKLIEENLEIIELKCNAKICNLNAHDRKLYAEAKYMQATYNAESMNICSEQNLRYFKEAIAANAVSESCYVQLAQYLEKMYESLHETQQYTDSECQLLLTIMLNYSKSLQYGCDNVYQSLPRLISLWLDNTSRGMALCESACRESSTNIKIGSLQELSRKMNDVLKDCSVNLPTAYFYTTFSQLLSRICHPSADVFDVLRTIIIKLIEDYPQQSLWMLLPIYKSSFIHRVKRCKLIFTDPRLAAPQFQKLLADFNTLTERFIELTNKEVSFDQVYELSTLVKQLPLLFKKSNFSEILLPFEKYMQPSFPVGSALKFKIPNISAQETPKQSQIPTNIFPYKQIYIRGFKNEITVLRSAAKPKKITIRCSDGRDYDVMVKPKDDLRKDFRLMEFNGLVKRYLHQDPQARRRRLHIRTYAAIPFNEECGLVEWLPKLNSFRAICNTFYRLHKLGIPDREIRKYVVPTTESAEKKRNIFLKKLLPSYPPIFHKWFHQQFATPHSWYEARSSYIKTVAVMSMVGYILGLGDRHGENILFDERSGEAVHVDFNCLFNRGELFAYPELVPFRLTHNMTAAMGILGIEGVYRKCCEITLRLLKQESKTLMSILRPFVYDLVVQSRNYVKKNEAELTDPKATADVRRIAERLQGYVKNNIANSIPLSTEGQVNFLIAEATNIDNLAAMYIGWGAFI